MNRIKSFEDLLYALNDENSERIALDLFKTQRDGNPVYGAFVANLNLPEPSRVEEIPFLPISFFKNQVVRTYDWQPETTFTSSGTTGMISSSHHVKSVAFYRLHAQKIFESIYGSLKDFHVLALLPSYLEREGSSLVVMADHFIRESASPYSGFYLNNLAELADTISQLKRTPGKILLLGVTFALLDLAEQLAPDLSGCIVMETGGMKGRRKEIIRDELHAILCDAFKVNVIHSEYGMTELLSQAYSLGSGLFLPSPTMRVIIRDVNDPRKTEAIGRMGAINVIDFANIYTCAFVETEDLGRINEDGRFEVLGRMDNSDIRGCNLLVG